MPGPTLSFDKASRRIKQGVSGKRVAHFHSNAKSRLCRLTVSGRGWDLDWILRAGGTRNGKHHLKWVGVGRAPPRNLKT